MSINQHMPEQRSETRMLCADMVEASWKDKAGSTRKSTALLEDISLTGACLQLDVPVPLNTPMRIVYPKGRLDGTVCYCVFREIGYFVGLQFVAQSRWTRRDFQPQHLLDLRRLVLKSIKRAAKRLPAQTTH